MPDLGFQLSNLSFAIDLSVGHIVHFTIDEKGRVLSPLHRAPWVDDPDAVFEETTPPNVRRLSGDFFCAPFGRNDVEPAPSHGWPANSAWSHSGTEESGDRLTAVFTLERKVMGATVEKRLTLRAGHPFLYQEHRLLGGEGAISVAHHVMVQMAAGGQLAVSPKSFAFTPDVAPEPDAARGRSILAYPSETSDLTSFPLANGGAADLGRFPPGERHEDFITLVEATMDEPNSAPGWSVASRNAEQDRVLVLKNTAQLPVTMLWMSNGGRDYAPWSGRHSGVLGIEDARASGAGHADSIRPNPLNARGVPTAFTLSDGKSISVRHAIGACSIHTDEGDVVGLATGSGRITLRFTKGRERSLVFDDGFLAGL
ncbi:MAG: hypothetical protein RIA09_02700 [Hoeflea sp.]|uniref:hypothetical protein n=1 Tax=Hoeflea sp. TaxID=1940281 RepID=UPI0032EC85CE